MEKGYKIENEVPQQNFHFAIIVYNWTGLNIIQNMPVIENTSLLTDCASEYQIGIWKQKLID